MISKDKIDTEEKLIKWMSENNSIVDEEFKSKTAHYSREELLKILEEVCHNFGGMFHFFDEKGRSLPETREEAIRNSDRSDALHLLLKCDKFRDFFIRTMPEEYSANHVGEEAHCCSNLGAEIEEVMDFRFMRDDIL